MESNGQGRAGEEGAAPGTSPPGTFWDLLGGRVVQADGKSAVVTLDIRPHHLNMIGIVHGGVYASLLDSAMGLVAILARPDKKVVTTNLNLHYVRPAGEGTLTVMAELVHETRTQITVQGTARKTGGELCVLATGSFRALDPASGDGSKR